MRAIPFNNTLHRCNRHIVHPFISCYLHYRHTYSPSVVTFVISCLERDGKLCSDGRRLVTGMVLTNVVHTDVATRRGGFNLQPGKSWIKLK